MGEVVGRFEEQTAGQETRGHITLVAFWAFVWLAMQYLGYEELDAARHMIFGGIFRRTLNANLSISQLEMALRVAPTVDECWGALVETSRGFGFSEASLEFLDLRLTTRFTGTVFANKLAALPVQFPPPS